MAKKEGLRMKFDLKELRAITILYVEDDEMVRTQTVSMFENIFKKTLTAVDGAMGFKLFKQYQNEIDIIVTDINMPELTGLQLAEKINKINNKIPIIITTAYTDEEYLLKSLELNINKYVTKPLKIKELTISILKEVKKYQREISLTKTTQFLANKHLNSEKEVNELQKNLFLNEREIRIQRDVINDYISFLKLDKDGTIINVSNKFCTIYGYKKDKIQNKNISLICENSSLIQKKLLDAIKEKRVQSFTALFITKNNKQTEFLCEVYPLYENDDGLVSGYNLYQDTLIP